MSTSSGPLSVLLTSLPLHFAEALAEVVRLGFTHVDVVALAERPESHREALADSGLLVSCASAGRDLPAGQSLDAIDVNARRLAVQAVRRQLADAAQLGATSAYLVSPLREPASDLAERLRAFADSCAALSEHAVGMQLRLCLEPIPGRALERGDGMLVWLEGSGLARVQLLLDVGHCLISGEDPATLARNAGPRLGYVHLDDNDGVGDVHWPLCTGRLQRQQLADLHAALGELRYTGGLALELNPSNADPIAALRDGAVMSREIFR